MNAFVDLLVSIIRVLLWVTYVVFATVNGLLIPVREFLLQDRFRRDNELARKIAEIRQTSGNGDEAR